MYRARVLIIPARTRRPRSSAFGVPSFFFQERSMPGHRDSSAERDGLAPPRTRAHGTGAASSYFGNSLFRTIGGSCGRIFGSQRYVSGTHDIQARSACLRRRWIVFYKSDAQSRKPPGEIPRVLETVCKFGGTVVGWCRFSREFARGCVRETHACAQAAIEDCLTRWHRMRANPRAPQER